MPRDPRHDILFEPVQIGTKTLRNRFYQVPHCTGFGSEKPASQARFRGTKAEGGWAAVCTEEALVSPDSDFWPVVSQRIWEPDDARNLALMADEAHQHDSLAGVELTHGGAHGVTRESRWPAIAPSQLASDYYSSVVPKAMELDDIRRVRADWVRAAKLVRDAGFDIVYVYGGHSYLPLQFLSPFYNKRSDEYGGSLENRARFWLETLEVVREAVGDDCAIAVRFCVEALSPAGVELDEGLGFVRLADDLVDLWDVNVGSIVEWSKDSGASRFFAEGYQLEWTGRVREATAKPIVGVARLTNPDRMAEIIRSGAWDLIGAARPSISDPFLPRKIEEGRYGEVRECIGCNVCVLKAEEGNHIGCTQNATAGEEYRRGWHPELFEPAENRDRDVLVVGAGPAGMECAIVLGKRGFRRVHLVEAETEIGGITRWVPRLPGLGEWGRLLNWRTVQLEKLRNVEVLTGLRLDAAGVTEYGAELVVVATGSHWAGDGLNFVTHEPIPGANLLQPYVLTPEQVMLAGKVAARRARRRASTPTATSWRPGSPRSCGPTATMSRSSRRTIASRRSATTRSRGRFSASICTGSEFGGARARCSPESSRGASRPATSSASRSSWRPTRSFSSPSAFPTTRSTASSRPTKARGRTRESRPSTGSATASLRGSSPRRSSTGTGWHARSTPRTRRSRSRTSANAWCSSR